MIMALSRQKHAWPRAYARRKAEWTARASSRRATVLLERFEVSKIEWELAAGSHTTTSGVWCGVVWLDETQTARAQALRSSHESG